MKDRYNIYIVPDVYYCNKYEIIVYTDIRILYKCSQCHNNYYNFLVVPHARLLLCLHRMTLPHVCLITETFTLTQF